MSNVTRIPANATIRDLADPQSAALGWAISAHSWEPGDTGSTVAARTATWISGKELAANAASTAHAGATAPFLSPQSAFATVTGIKTAPGTWQALVTVELAPNVSAGTLAPYHPGELVAYQVTATLNGYGAWTVSEVAAA